MSKKFFNEVGDELTKISYRDEMRRFLKEMLTEEEMESLGKRWEIGRLLANGDSKRKVSRKLRMGRETVERWQGIWKLHRPSQRKKVVVKKTAPKKVSQKVVKRVVAKKPVVKVGAGKDGMIDLSGAW